MPSLWLGWQGHARFYFLHPIPYTTSNSQHRFAYDTNLISQWMKQLGDPSSYLFFIHLVVSFIYLFSYPFDNFFSLNALTMTASKLYSHNIKWTDSTHKATKNTALHSVRRGRACLGCGVWEGKSLPSPWCPGGKRLPRGVRGCLGCGVRGGGEETSA